MRVVVSGATGYVGGRLVDYLVDRGDEVVAVARETSDTRRLESVLGEDRLLLHGGGTPSLEAMLRQISPDVTIHLAANQDQSLHTESVDDLVVSNVLFGTQLAQAAMGAGAKAFVAAGTYSVHGEGSEDIAPKTLYAASKAAFSRILRFYDRCTSLRCLELELTDTYGPNDPRGKFLDLVAGASEESPLSATEGKQLVSLVHVDDVARAFVLAAELLLSGEELQPVYSVAASPIPLREVVRTWEEATGRQARVRWGERPYREHEIMAPFLHDRLPGWAPRISLAEGLTDIYSTPEG